MTLKIIIARRASVLLVALAVTFAITFAISASPAKAADVALTVDNFSFNPQTVKVKVGDTVTWTNADDIPHTVTSKTSAFRSKAMDTDDKFAFTFTAPGVFEYFCSLHPHMTGSIVVEPSGAK